MKRIAKRHAQKIILMRRRKDRMKGSPLIGRERDGSGTEIRDDDSFLRYANRRTEIVISNDAVPGFAAVICFPDRIPIGCSASPAIHPMGHDNILNAKLALRQSFDILWRPVRSAVGSL